MSTVTILVRSRIAKITKFNLFLAVIYFGHACRISLWQLHHATTAKLQYACTAKMLSNNNPKGVNYYSFSELTLEAAEHDDAYMLML